MKPYPKYKDSGVEWIGEVPKEWGLNRLKYMANQIIDGTHFTPTYVNKGIPFLRVTDIQTNEIDLDNVKYISEHEHFELIKRCHPQKGDLLLSKNGTIGITKVIDWDFSFSIFVSLCLIKFKNDKLIPRYFTYIFQSDIAEEQVFGSSKKTSVTNLHLDKIRELVFLTPPIHEQKQIAAYLDHKTAQIDTLVAKKKRLIELLKEERTAVINQAVTKGLDPNVTMKDSGIEWLGEIPEHWMVKRLKYISDVNPSNIDKKSKVDENGVLLCNYVDVYKNDFISSELEFMKATATDAQIEKFILENGDVIATKDSETPDDIANPALVTEDFEGVVCGYHLTHIKPKEINGSYLFRFFQSKFLQSYFEVSANGITRFGLGVDKFTSALILNPPAEEQQKIVDHIDKEAYGIDTIITKTEKEIELLQEYRTALISEVVTGKIDVRDWKEPK